MVHPLLFNNLRKYIINIRPQIVNINLPRRVDLRDDGLYGVNHLVKADLTNVLNRLKELTASIASRVHDLMLIECDKESDMSGELEDLLVHEHVD